MWSSSDTQPSISRSTNLHSCDSKHTHSSVEFEGSQPVFTHQHQEAPNQCLPIYTKIHVQWQKWILSRAKNTTVAIYAVTLWQKCAKQNQGLNSQAQQSPHAVTQSMTHLCPFHLIYYHGLVLPPTNIYESSGGKVKVTTFLGREILNCESCQFQLWVINKVGWPFDVACGSWSGNTFMWLGQTLKKSSNTFFNKISSLYAMVGYLFV